jgi:hypothetical protein
MATIQDIAELLIKVGGIEELKKAADALQRVGQAGKQAAVDIYDFADVYDVIEAESPKAAAALDTVATATTRVAVSTKGVGKAHDEHKEKIVNVGQAAIQTSYFMQDLVQGGFGAVINNLPNMASALGGGAGVAGLIGGVGVAALLLQSQLKTIFSAIAFEAFDPLRDRTKDLQKRIEELEGKTHKVPVEVVELQNAREEADRLKAALEAVERLRRGQTEAEAKSGRAVREAVGEAPGGSQAVLAALTSQITKELTEPLKESLATETAEARKNLQESEAGLKQLQEQGKGGTEAAAQLIGLINFYKDRIGKAETDYNAQLTAITKRHGTAETRAGEIVETAEKGAGAVQAAKQEELRRRLEMGGFGLAAVEVSYATPEAVQADEAAKRDYENQKRRAQLQKQLDKKQEERTKKELEELEKQLEFQADVEKGLTKTAADARKKQADQAAAAERRRLATLAKRIGGGTLSDEAQDYAARVQEARPGISDADLRAAVQAAVAAEVARRAPQLAPAERAGVTTAVTEQALAAPPEDVAARQARAAAALPRQQRAEMQAGYAQEAQMRGANPQQAAQIGRLATAAFEKTGDLQGSFMQGVMEFQQIMGRMLAQQQGLMNGMQQVHANNRNMQARLQTAQKEWGR